MYWEDEAFIVGKRKFRENAIILDVFTKNFGKVSGIVYGGTSRKIKNYLQVSNKIFIIFNSKSENKIGYFKTELIDAISPRYFNDQKKTTCLNSITSIIKILLPENEVQKKIYNSLNSLLIKFSDENWLLYYLSWEIDLIHDLGFGFDMEDTNIRTSNSNELININVDKIDYKIPNFIISKNFDNVSQKDIFNGLSFSRNLMENKFFHPNNLRMPYSRILLEKKIL